MTHTAQQDVQFLRNYKSALDSSRPLSSKEEAALAQRIRRGDEAARNDLVSAHLGFVIYIAKRYLSCGLPLEELVSAGNMGLIEAAERFDETRGNTFISYAVWWIRKYIKEVLTKETGFSDFAQVRLDAPRFGEDSGETFLEGIASVNPEPVEDIQRREAAITLSIRLRRVTPREKLVLKAYFGWGSASRKTLKEVGSMLGVSEERARQIIEYALRKLYSGGASKLKKKRLVAVDWEYLCSMPEFGSLRYTREEFEYDRLSHSSVRRALCARKKRLYGDCRISEYTIKRVRTFLWNENRRIPRNLQAKEE